jgi:hypothetical protein
MNRMCPKSTCTSAPILIVQPLNFKRRTIAFIKRKYYSSLSPDDSDVLDVALYDHPRGEDFQVPLEELRPYKYVSFHRF